MDPIEEISKNVSYSTQTQRRIRSRNNGGMYTNSYMKQPVDLQKTPFLFFPPGKEMLFLGIYFAILPYIAGLLFLFFYVSEGKASVFGSITINSDANFFLVWIIGYELLATVAILWIVKNAIMFSINNAQNQRSHHQGKRRYR